MSAPDVNPTQGFRPTRQQLNWDAEQFYWRANWHGRPYANADRGYEHYEPGYRFGVESADRYHGRTWDDAAPHLRADWDSYEHRGSSSWEQMKDAVRDAWNRVTGA